MNEIKCQQDPPHKNNSQNTILMHYSSNLSYLCSTSSKLQKCFHLIYIQTHTITTILAHSNGRPIQWPLNTIDYVVSGLNTLISEMNQWRLNFVVKNYSIYIILKNNRLVKKDEQQSHEKIPNYSMDNTFNNPSPTFQQQIQKFSQQQMQIFKKIIQEISHHIQRQMLLVGIIKKQEAGRINTKLRLQRTSLHILMIQKSLELNKNISGIINGKYNIELYNVCNQNMVVRLNFKQDITQSRRNNIQNNTRSSIKNEQRQINQKLNVKIQKYISKLMVKLRYRPQQNIEQAQNQEQEKKQEQQNQMVDIKCADEINTNLYQIVRLKQGSCYLQIVGGVSIVSRMLVKRIQYCIKHKNPDEDEHEQIDNIYMGKKIFKQNDDIQHQHNNKLRFRRQLDIIRQINRRSSTKRHYLVDYYFYPHNLDVYYLTWHQLTLQAYLDLYHTRMSIGEILELSIQLVIMVIDLHRIGVIHRDLKPSNILVEIYGPIAKLKLIDFTDSIVKDSQQVNKILRGQLTIYSTPIFCPLEASLLSKDHSSKGIANDAIDKWSIGVLVYQILHNKVPISYSHNTVKDIHDLWQSQFLQLLTLRPSRNIAKAKQILELITFSLLHMQQEKRMGLDKVLSLLLVAAVYVEDVKQMTKCVVHN